jgi:hypothetical protein
VRARWPRRGSYTLRLRLTRVPRFADQAVFSEF